MCKSEEGDAEHRCRCQWFWNWGFLGCRAEMKHLPETCKLQPSLSAYSALFRHSLGLGFILGASCPECSYLLIPSRFHHPDSYCARPFVSIVWNKLLTMWICPRLRPGLNSVILARYNLNIRKMRRSSISRPSLLAVQQRLYNIRLGSLQSCSSALGLRRSV